MHYASLAYYNSSKCQETIKTLLEDGLADATIDIGGEPFSTAFHIFHGPVDAFSYMTTAIQKNYEEVADYTLAWQCGRCYGALPTAYARAAFAKNAISPQRALHIDKEAGTQRTLLHAVAANLADSAVVPFDSCDTLFILKQLLNVNANLHARDKYGATPFDYLCYGTHHSRDVREEQYKSAMLQWIQALHSQGLDLHAYAEEEDRLHPTGTLIHCCQLRIGVIRKFQFLYGASKDELSINVEDVSVGIPIEQQVPGCWPEYDEKDHREIINDMVPFSGWALQFEPVDVETEHVAS
jgi:hypothetical protein